MTSMTEARPGRVGRRHRELRLLALLPGGRQARGRLGRARHVRRPRGDEKGHTGGLLGRSLAALRYPPRARLRARPGAGISAGARGIVALVFRAKDAVQAGAMCHLACEMCGECCPKVARIPGEAELAYLDYCSHIGGTCARTMCRDAPTGKSSEGRERCRRYRRRRRRPT